jgi:4-hydroxy-tetrahydrodipicolinate synthase
MADGLYPLFGVVSVLLTPFDEDGRIDYGSFGASIDERIDAGVAGLVTPAVAGEAATLSLEERRGLARFAADRAAGRVPVLAGAAEPEDARAAAAAGCAGALVQPDGGDLRRRLEAFAETGIPMLMLQDLDWNGPGLPVETIRALHEAVPAFRCVKIEAAPAGPKYSVVLAATGGTLNVSGGWASTQLIEALDRGVHAFLPSAHHRVYGEIFRRHRAGDRDGARELYERLLPVLAFCTQHVDVSIRFQKLLMVRLGLFRNATMRAPSVRFDEHHRRVAEELLDRAVELHRVRA